MKAKTPAGGKSLAKKGLKRLKHKLYDGSSALNKPSIRRLARRGGVKRINAGVYAEIPLALKCFLSKIIKDAITYAEHSRRLTIVTNDVILALKRNGLTLYGYDIMEKRRRLLRPLQHEHLAAAATRIALRRSAASQQHQATAPSLTADVAAPTGRTSHHTQTRGNNTPNALHAPSSSAAAITFTHSAPRNQKKVSMNSSTAAKKPSALSQINPTTVLTASNRINKKSPISVAEKSFNNNNIANKQQQTAKAAPRNGPEVPLERAFDIQSSLSAFRDAVIARQSSSDATMQRVVEWVDAHLRGSGKPSCSMAEVEVVLEALNERDAIMLTGSTVASGNENDENQRIVWFV